MGIKRRQQRPIVCQPHEFRRDLRLISPTVESLLATRSCYPQLSMSTSARLTEEHRELDAVSICALPFLLSQSTLEAFRV